MFILVVGPVAFLRKRTVAHILPFPPLALLPQSTHQFLKPFTLSPTFPPYKATEVPVAIFNIKKTILLFHKQLCLFPILTPYDQYTFTFLRKISVVRTYIA